MTHSHISIVIIRTQFTNLQLKTPKLYKILVQIGLKIGLAVTN